MSLILGLFAGIDFGIYSLVALLFNLILEIANKDIFTDEAISGIAYKVYAILAVVIIFKVTIACIQYLVNPSTFSDNEKGLGGIFKRVLISLALMAVVPMLFTFAKSAQNTIALAIPQVILNLDSDEVDVDSAGDTLARMVLYVFIQPNEGKNADAVIMNKGDGKFKAWDLQTFLDKAAEGCTFFSTSGCKYDYKWYFSVPVGIFLLYMFLTMGIDVAVRAIKLGLLEILAPVCISSYITNGKNGKKSTFQNWYSLCIKVYSDLFIRLAIVYLIIFFVILISQGGLNFSDDNGWVTLFLILGVLYFAKSAPKFLSDVLGLDSDGALKDMFTPFHKKAGVGGLAAMAAAPVKSAASIYSNSKENGESKARALKRAALGFASSAGRATSAALQGKSFKDSMVSATTAPIKNASKHTADHMRHLNDKKQTEANRQNYINQNNADAQIEGAKNKRTSAIESAKAKLASALGVADTNHKNAIDAANAEYQSGMDKLNNLNSRSQTVSKNLTDSRARLAQVESELRDAKSDDPRTLSLSEERSNLMSNIAKSKLEMKKLSQERASMSSATELAAQRDAAIAKINGEWTMAKEDANRECSDSITLADYTYQQEAIDIENRRSEIDNEARYQAKKEYERSDTWFIDRKVDVKTALGMSSQESVSKSISAANLGLETRNAAWNRAESKVLESPGKITTKTSIDMVDKNTDVSVPVEYTFSELDTRIKTLTSNPNLEKYNNELEILTQKRQKVLDNTKIEYITEAFETFHGKDKNRPPVDTQLTNTFAENIFKLNRSGGDPNGLAEILNPKVKLSDGREVTVNLVSVASKIERGEVITDVECKAAANYVSSGMNAAAGKMRLKATRMQIENDSKKGGS